MVNEVNVTLRKTPGRGERLGEKSFIESTVDANLRMSLRRDTKETHGRKT